MRTIDADAIPYTMIYRENWMRGTGGEEQAAWKSSIDAMPTIEPERKKGEWKNDKCSVCGYGVQPWNNTPFCPKCGADLRGD